MDNIYTQSEAWSEGLSNGTCKILSGAFINRFTRVNQPLHEPGTASIHLYYFTDAVKRDTIVWYLDIPRPMGEISIQISFLITLFSKSNNARYAKISITTIAVMISYCTVNIYTPSEAWSEGLGNGTCKNPEYGKSYPSNIISINSKKNIKVTIREILALTVN